MHFVELVDWILFPFYLLAIYSIIRKFWEKNCFTLEEQKKFKVGFWLKILGMLIYVIYHAVKQTGDSHLFYDTGTKIFAYLKDDPITYFQLIFGDDENLRISKLAVLDDVVFEKGNYYPCKLSAFFLPLSLGYYLPCALIITSISYVFAIDYIKKIKQLFPNYEPYVYYILLFVPTIFIWSTCINKDIISYTLTLSFVSTCLFIIKFKKVTMKDLFIIFFSVKTVFIIKSYIILTALPFLAYYIINNLFFTSLNQVFKSFIGFFGIFLVYQLFLNNKIANDEFALNILAEQLLNTNLRTSDANIAGSTYNLGIDYNLISGFESIKPYVLKSINVTLFRPYIFEIKSYAMILNALESTFTLILSIFIILKNGVFNTMILLFKNPLALFFLMYALIFSALVGVASGNFGTLVRYKIPCLPFWGLFLLMVYIDFNERRKSKLKPK